MKITSPIKDVYLMTFDDTYEAGMSMIRISEFYEHPASKIKGKYFDLEDMIDLYYKKGEGFTYPDEWCGYNAPSVDIQKFIKVFQNKLRPREEKLLLELSKHVDILNDKYCLIVTCGADQKSTINHEIAHAFYYLNEDYREDMDEITDNLKVYKRMAKEIKKMGYCEAVIHDEIQACLATSSSSYLENNFSIKHLYSYTKEYKKVFKGYYNEFRNK